MNNTIEVKPEVRESRVMIYEGEAPVIQDPKIIGITGTIDAPSLWLSHKEVAPAKAHVLVNRENLSITLHLEDKDAFGDTIIGKAEFHPIFKKFEINSGTYRTPAELAQLFKMNRSFFENQSTAMKLVSELQNFKAKVAGEVERSENNRGDKRDLTAQVVNSNIPENFKINIPIFKGQAKQNIEIEIYINPADLTCSLVSPQANDLTEAYRDEMIETQITAITGMLPTITIIEQ